MKKSAITSLTDAGEYMNIERELKVGESIFFITRKMYKNVELSCQNALFPHFSSLVDGDVEVGGAKKVDSGG